MKNVKNLMVKIKMVKEFGCSVICLLGTSALLARRLTSLSSSSPNER